MIHTSRTRRGVAAGAVTALLVLLGPAALPAWGTPTPTSSPDTVSATPTTSPSAPSSAPSSGSATSSTSTPRFSWEAPPLGATPVPDDPNRPDKPYAQSNGQACIVSGVGNTTITDEPKAQSMLDIKGAQRLSTGAGVTVAVIDTGVNPHPYLVNNGRLRNGGDYVLGDNNALSDCDGHGTIVAGIIAANTAGQGIDFTGVAPQANILAIKQTSEIYGDPSGNGQGAGDVTTLAQAIVHAANTPGVRVITMSVDNCLLAADAPGALASPQYQALHRAIDYAVNVKDEVVVAAAGNWSSGNSHPDQNGQKQSGCQNAKQNDNPDPNQVNQVQVPPVYADDVLSVASVSPDDGSVSSFSVWGPWVSIAAPGEQITSLDPGAGGKGLSNQTYDKGQPVTLQGTSFAAPYVAGLAALIRARFPSLTAHQVMYRIEATAQHPSGPGGRNNQVGYGLINPVAALTAVIPGQNGMPSDIATAVQIPADLSSQANNTALAIRIALIGTAVGAVLFVGIAFAVNARRRQAHPVDGPVDDTE